MNVCLHRATVLGMENATGETRMSRTEQAADRLVFVDETGSTNTLARELIGSGELAGSSAGESVSSPVGERAGGPAREPSGESAPERPYVAVVAADRQTAGRGRLDHTWQSAPGESSTVSYVVTVPRALATDPTVNGWLQMIAGLAALDGLRSALAALAAQPLRGIDGDTTGDITGEAAVIDAAGRLGLKWPNDLFLDGRKLGGILAEFVPLPGRESSEVAIVFGIGLNLAVPADRLPTPQSTSLHLHYGPLPAGDDVRDLIAAGTVAALRRRLAAFAADLRAAAASSRRETVGVCVTLGRRAVAHFTDGSTLEGAAVALNADASLTIRDDAGVAHVVRTADVGVLPDPA